MKSCIAIMTIVSTFSLTACSPQTDVGSVDPQTEVAGQHANSLPKPSGNTGNATGGDTTGTPSEGSFVQDKSTVNPSNPPPPPQSQSKDLTKPVSVRGIYMTHAMLVGNQFHAKQTFLKNTRLNAIVVDIKDDSGNVFLDAKTKYRIQALRQQHIYTIARFVVFKDPVAAKHHPNWTIRTANGAIWKHNGVAWVDPTNVAVQSYNLGVAKRVATLGVDEIQFDYIRFPDADLKHKRFAQATFKRSSVIRHFLEQATPMLHRQGVRTSADVFGLVTSASDDMGIGQIWEQMSPHVDYLSPMMYPSHYSTGSYGAKHPVLNPYTVIRGGLKDAIKRDQMLQKKGIKTAVIRPWFQDFDMKANYTSKEVTAQITAARHLGVNQYLLWNQGGQYTTQTKF